MNKKPDEAFGSWGQKGMGTILDDVIALRAEYNPREKWKSEHLKIEQGKCLFRSTAHF